MASSADIALLRCEADRLASVAVKEGATLVAPAQTKPALDPAFIAWIADVGGYAITMWELELLRTLGYSAFNRTFDSLQLFVENPALQTAQLLEPYVPLYTALFSAAATRRGVPARCGVRLTFPGLEPPDPRILPPNLPDDLDVPVPPPRVFKLPFGLKVTIGAGASLLLLAFGMSWTFRRRQERALPHPKPPV